MCITTLMASICMLLVWRLHPIIPLVFWLVLTFVEGIFLTSVLYKVHLFVLMSVRMQGTLHSQPGKQQSHPQMHRVSPCLTLKKKKKITSFGQPSSLIARGRASATLPNVIHLCQTKCR